MTNLDKQRLYLEQTSQIIMKLLCAELRMIRILS